HAFWASGKPRPFDNFVENFAPDFDSGQYHPNALSPASNRPLAADMTADRDGTLHAIYEQILRDRDQMQMAMVNGKVVIEDDGKDGKASIPKGNQRDPAKGFLNLRGEVVIEAVRSAGLRWGGAMMGIGINTSGDMMHFDLNRHGTEGRP